MDDRRLRIILVSTAAAMIACAAIYVVERPKTEAPAMPDDPDAIARRLAAHPADWRAASALTEHALDAQTSNRVALWRAANDAALRLAPDRDAPRMAFAKSAFFHWEELSPADRAAAIAEITPLLHDEPTFLRMAQPLFDLTGDFALLRRANPATITSLSVLETLAATYGRFADYRSLRAELLARQRSDFFANVGRVPPAEVIALLPPPPYHVEDEPMIVAALRELHARPLDGDPQHGAIVTALVDYAVRHRLQPLDGIEILERSPQMLDALPRLQLARALGRGKDIAAIKLSSPTPLKEPKAGEWQGVNAELTTSRIAWIEREMFGASVLTVQNVRSDDVPPYVEIYFDDVRVGEGAVTDVLTFPLPAATGMHRIEVDVVNPRTRNDTPRAVRIVSVVP